MYSIENDLVQNFYEHTGDFSKIRNHSAYNALAAIVPDLAAKNLENECYKAIGYDGKDKRFVGKDLHDLRMAYLTGSLTKAKKIAGVKNKKELEKLLEAQGDLPEIFSENVTVKSKELREYTEVLARYYKNSQAIIRCTINDNVRIIPMNVYLKGIIYEGKEAISLINQLVVTNVGALVTFKEGDSLSIEDGVMTLPKMLPPDKLSKLQLQALCLASLGRIQLPQLFVKDPVSILTARINAPNTYLSMLEAAELQGITYAKMLEEINITLPHDDAIYNTYGVIFYSVKDKALVLSQEEGEPLEVTNMSAPYLRQYLATL